MSSDSAIKRRDFVPGAIPAWNGKTSSTSQWGLTTLTEDKAKCVHNVWARTIPREAVVQESEMFNLPIELMDMLIFSLDLNSIRALRSCRALNAFLDRDGIWKHFYQRDFPQCQKGEKQTYKDAYNHTHVLRENLAHGIFSEAKLSGHAYKVTAFAAASGMLITGSEDNYVVVWSLESGKQVKTIPKIGGVNSFAIAGSRLYSSSYRFFESWDFPTMRALYCYNSRGSDAIVVLGEKGFFPNNNGIMARNLTKDIEKLQFSSEEHLRPIMAMIAADGKIATGSKDFTAKVWDAENLKCLQTLSGHTGVVRCLASWEKALISGSEDKSIKIWEMDSGRCLHTFSDAHDDQVDFLGVTRGILISGSSERRREFKVWDLEKKTLVNTLKHESSQYRSFLAQGRLYIGDLYGDVTIWDFKASDVKILQSIAACFRGENSDHKKRALGQIQRMPKEKREKIYAQLEKLKPSLKSKGEEAFLDSSCQEASFREKAAAIEFYLAEYLGYEYRNL